MGTKGIVPVTTKGMVALALAACVCLHPLLASEEKSPLSMAPEALRKSEAYQKFRSRPVTDLSKLIYLIDRFAKADIQIRYNNIYFKARDAARVARWFLSRHYQGETTEEWIMRWCNTSFPSGELIWVKSSNGRFYLAREVLKAELKALEQAVRDEVASKIEQQIDQAVDQIVLGPLEGPPLKAPGKPMKGEAVPKTATNV